jgi:glycosyltransferase involved in cell wall biosynthesis
MRVVMTTSPPRLSIVVPALNEREAMPGLLDEIESACEALGTTFEVIVVDDGSTDGTFAMLERMSAERPWLRGVKLRRNFGKSAALATGFEAAQGERILTIDGDGQDDPADFGRLLAALDDGAALASGWKHDRRDPFSRRVASSIFNRTARLFSGLDMHDMNSGIKAYEGDCARSLEIYGEMHRYLPMLAAQQGWLVEEVPVNHRAREHGSSKFGSERYLRGALDLLTVSFLGRYQNRPLHFFGGIGVLLTLAGVLISLYLTAVKIGGEPIGERPLLFLGVLLIVVGIQLLTLGLLGQMLVLVRRERGPTRSEAAQVARTFGDGTGPPVASNDAISQGNEPSTATRPN